MKTTEETLANNIRTLRKNMNITQEELSNKIGFSKKTVSKWELGDCIPSVSTIVKLAQILGTDVNSMVGYTFAPQYFLGIDGGATKTDFRLCDAEGKVVNTCKLSACNPVDIGMENAKVVLNEGIETVCKGIPKSLISVFAGISGGMTGKNKTEINKFLGDFGFSKYANGSDVENAISVALDGKDGVAAIMGTGSVIFAVKCKNRYRIGGYGYYFDNGGSGFDIGCSVLRSALNAFDKSGEPTILLKMCERKLAGNIVDAIGEIYQKGKTFVASFAPLAFEAYKKGDKVAESILNDSMKNFANKLNVCKEYFDKDFNIYLVGGLCNDADIFMPILNKYLDCKLKVSICEKSQVEGALKLAGLKGEI